MKSLSLLAVALAVASASASAQNINYSYRVTGDAQARPVQAFDDGRQLYIQLRDATSPPAPMGAAGPILYTMRGPYMVMSIVPSVQLRYGPYTAMVQSSATGDASPGVVSVTRPIEVSESALTAPAAIVPAYVPAPAPVRYAQPATASTGRVTGEIVATGPAGTRTTTVAASGSDAVRHAREVGSTAAVPVDQSVGYDAGKARATYSPWRGRKLVIRADGTTAGASAALAGRAACRSAGATCTIEYRGAAAGQLNIVEKN